MNSNIDIKYNDKTVKNNIFLTPAETQIEPKISYNSNNDLYTFLMHDPDSIHGDYCHWLIINIPGNKLNNGDTILPYKGPSPPPKTGIHRYIFELYKQNNRLEPLETVERNISMNDIKNKIGISSLVPISTIQFLSENENKFGGKKRKRKTTKKRKRRNKTKRHLK
jgi:phosphatidylethanolamine-binding protein (PEBP) family uncharacterized protein